LNSNQSLQAIHTIDHWFQQVSKKGM